MWSDDDDYFSYSPYYFGSNDDMDDDSADDHYFDDAYDEYYYSSGEDCSGLVLARNRIRSKDNDSDVSVEVAPTPSYKVAPLQDLCCRFIARRFPFAFIEHRSPPIPDELQLKIIQFSFPEDEKMIQKYAEFSRSSVDYCSAKRMLENGNVKDMNQIGFRLSASVEDRVRCSSRSPDNGKYYVTVHFDRGKITSAHCSCELSTNWCSHVVATCLARIKNKNTVTIHMPVSDSLNSLDREQLLKFAQYLLCEHQNERVVETAQQLLDKLLSRQQQDQQEDINVIAGAPDPTAGPGLDEEAHWFVSKSGFKSRCESLMYESQADLGFVMYNDMDNDRGSSVYELWERNCLQQALVRDEMDLQLDNEYHSYSSSRHQSVLQVLETIADLLQDDFMSAVSALTMCTEQLIERLNKLCRVNSPADRYRLVHRVMRCEPKEAIILCGSLAGGFTPRVSETLSDELSRLWRLAVLRPGIPAKQHQGVIDQLRTLNQTVSVAFVTGALRPWQGLEVAIRLSSIDQNADDFQRVLKGEWVQFPVVSSCMEIQLTCQSKSLYVSEWMAMEEGQRNDDAAQARCESTMSLSFHSPHCISFGPHFDTDIHSVCSMIEALNVSGNHLGAMRLTVALSCALVSFYKSLLFGSCDVTSMPVSARCSLGAVHKIGPKPAENGESPMEVETPSDKASNGHVWPEDTILSITTFTFLCELLSQKPDLADTCLVEMRSKLSPAETILDCVRSVHSLKFHVGVLGLFLQRLPAPSLHHEVEEYNYECWLTYQLICSSPTDTDLSFLSHLGQHVIGTTTPRPVPPSSLSRVIFHHLFKGAPAALSKCLTERQSVGLGAAFHVLGHVNEYTVKESSSSWMLFQYANCRLWAKLAEVVLRSLSDSQELLERAMSCVLQPNGMLGAQSLENLSVDSTPLSVLSRLRDVEFITSKCRVAYCLAKSLSEKQGNTIKMMQYKKETGNRVTRRESLEMEMPRKIMKSGVEKALKLCAVQIAAHSLWLQKLADRSRVHNDTVRWLTDFVVSSGIDTVQCLVKCKGDVTSFFAQSELLDLCEKVLKKEEHMVTSLGREIVQGIILSLLQKASQSEASDDMKRIVSFCRDKRCATKVDLLPWICKGLQSLADSNAFLRFEVLMDASHGMLEHYREKLATTESVNRVLWNQKGALCLNRLFNEGVHVEDDSDNENGDSVLANRNPYRTPEPHPFLQTAFDLGMMGLEKLKEKPDDLLNGRYPHYRRCPVKEHLNEFCRLVCYLVNKKWLTEASSGSPGSPSEIESPKKADDMPSTVNAKPGCSHWEDAQSQSESWMSVDSCYLHKFVCSLISGVENPLWLFDVLQELGDHLCTEVVRSSPTSRQERQNLQVKEACQCYPSVKLLLQRDLDEFSKLLLGPEMSTVIDEVVRRRDRRRLEPSEIIYELGHCQLMNTRLKDVLKTAKRAFSISDSSGSLFRNLTDEMTSQHSILHPLVDGVLKDKEPCSSDEREVALFPRASILPALFAQGLFPGLFERSLVDDYF